MRIFNFLIIISLVYSCANTNKVYWCGDHPCINNKEKEAYFKKTMIVEIRELSKKSIKKDSDIDKLMKQAKIDEKKRILSEKELEKKLKNEKKERAKQEKELSKQIAKQEKELLKKTNTDPKEIETISKVKKQDSNLPDENTQMVSTNDNINNELESFDDIVDIISKRNNAKSYPDINDLPN